MFPGCYQTDEEIAAAAIQREIPVSEILRLLTRTAEIWDKPSMAGMVLGGTTEAERLAGEAVAAGRKAIPQ